MNTNQKLLIFLREYVIKEYIIITYGYDTRQDQERVHWLYGVERFLKLEVDTSLIWSILDNINPARYRDAEYPLTETTD